MSASFKRKKWLIAMTLILGAWLCIELFTPSVWKWKTYNLQVHINRNLPVDGSEPSGSYGDGYGWSKMGLVLGDWWRKSSGTSGNAWEESEARITGISHGGVWVKVNYSKKLNGVQTVAFDKTIFVTSSSTSGNPVRLDLSDEYYITGYFERD